MSAGARSYILTGIQALIGVVWVLWAPWPFVVWLGLATLFLSAYRMGAIGARLADDEPKDPTP